MKSVRLLKVADAVVSAPLHFAGKKPYFATGDVDGTELGGASMVTFEDRPSRANLTAKPGDILFAKMQATSKVVHVTESSSNAVFSTGFCNLRPNIDLLASRYLFHFLNSPIFQHAKDRRCTGATQKALTLAALREIEIPLPENIDEQNRIAAKLDMADAIRRKREKALTLADDFLRSVFLEMFGDPLTNPKGFKKQKVALHLNTERSGVQSGPFGAALKKHEYTTSGIPVWGVENVQINRFIDKARLFITEEKFHALDRYRVKNGDVLISRAGTVGRMCIAETTVRDSIISTNLTRVSLNPGSLTPEFFVSLFTYVPERLGALKANNKDDAFTFLHPSTLKETEIPIPDMATQQRFVQMVERHRANKSFQEEHLGCANDLFASLSQRAFAGDL